MESLEPRVLLAADPLLAPFPQAILANLGRSAIDDVGDIDGDGWGDVLVGASSTDSAFLLSGRTGAVLREHVRRTPFGDIPEDSFGGAVAGIGDVTGDGVPDYAISAPLERHGVVRVYSGATGEEIASLTTSSPGSNGFGTSLLGLGDVNGDAVPDFAVGAPFEDFHWGTTTFVGIYSGADFSQHTIALREFYGIGHRLDLVGDVDGDGAADFFSHNRVHSGATGDLIYQLDVSVVGNTNYAGCASITDVDGDGVRDLVTNTVSGTYAIFSGINGAFLRTLLPFATSGVSIGDRDGDGFDEIAVQVDNGIQVRSTLDGSILQEISRPGLHVFAMIADDVNNDGRTDLLALVTGGTAVLFGQDVGDESEVFDRASLHAHSSLSVTSEDGLLMAGVNRYGDLIAYTRASIDAPWQMHTVVENAGIHTLDVFRDQRTGRLTIAVSSYDGMKLFAFVPTGDWVHTEVDDSGGRITGLMRAFAFADGHVGIVGQDSSGQILLYEQAGAGWQFTNITLDLLVHRQPTAAFEEFTVYVAPWNAVHLTGRSSTGELVTVWRADHGEHWIATPIGAEVPEANQLSNLSAFVAPWGGLHVAGVTPEGHVGVLWWSPELTETGWEYTDLTAGINGPLFKQAHIAANVTGWGGLNIYGVNTDGDLTAYWWVPGAQWVAETLAVDRDAAPLVGPVAVLDSIFEPRHDGMRIAASSAEGDILIYTWRPAQGAVWLYENLTAMPL